ncbi:hypothetical protein [Amycolatopsis saalfeldensis]|uniref:Uncharacterized protein n=1 Tax=Amycolatopsis saalfeldensis TaxID=394193 RepID=A0A1H8SMR0_9PSEU|nr:hypothetical protein [Amycolatopsis saalfeldensis]SEO79644.1 hypothetical protein SAMN04489732_102189 [Amycolatopsis saalfeldensis]
MAEAGRSHCRTVVRLQPTVLTASPRGLIEIARAAGVSGYVGDGASRWPSADTRDTLDWEPSRPRLVTALEKEV